MCMDIVGCIYTWTHTEGSAYCITSYVLKVRIHSASTCAKAAARRVARSSSNSCCTSGGYPWEVGLKKGQKKKETQRQTSRDKPTATGGDRKRGSKTLIEAETKQQRRDKGGVKTCPNPLDVAFFCLFLHRGDENLLWSLHFRLLWPPILFSSHRSVNRTGRNSCSRSPGSCVPLRRCFCLFTLLLPQSLFCCCCSS